MRHRRTRLPTPPQRRRVWYTRGAPTTTVLHCTHCTAYSTDGSFPKPQLPLNAAGGVTSRPPYLGPVTSIAVPTQVGCVHTNPFLGSSRRGRTRRRQIPTRWLGVARSRGLTGAERLGGQVARVTKMLGDEFGTASNIKNRVNRQSVLGAITSAQQRLKLYNRVPPVRPLSRSRPAEERRRSTRLPVAVRNHADGCRARRAWGFD
jgi:hypothetical protein